jgi:hypothetical protein
VHRAKAALLAGRADFARGRVARARRRFEQGIQIAQKLRLAYDEALLDTEIARMLAPSDPERRQRLWRALAVFTERRATWDVARAQALLGD